MVKTQSIQSPEELEAQLNEGMAPISEEGLELQATYHRLSESMKELKAARDAIQELLIEEMDEKGVDILTHNGVPVVSYNDTTNTKVNHAEFILAHPDIYATYVSKDKGKRFDAKKPLTNA